MLKKIKSLAITLIILPISYFPLRWLQAIGACLGKIALRFNKKRLHIVRRNIEVCFPELSPSEQAELLIEVSKEFGKWFFVKIKSKNGKK